MRPTRDGFRRIGIALKQRQIERARELKALTGIGPSTLFAVFLDAASDEEVMRFYRTHLVIKSAEAIERANARSDGKMAPAAQAAELPGV